MGRGLSESRGSGLVREYVGLGKRTDVLGLVREYAEEADVLTYLVFHRSKDVYLRTDSPYRR